MTTAQRVGSFLASRLSDAKLQDDVDEMAARLVVANVGACEDSIDAQGARYLVDEAFKIAEIFIGVREKRRGRM